MSESRYISEAVCCIPVSETCCLSAVPPVHQGWGFLGNILDRCRTVIFKCRFLSLNCVFDICSDNFILSYCIRLFFLSVRSKYQNTVKLLSLHLL
jgi:hypothetical protein